MIIARLASRETTVLWEGDVLVLGAGLAGLNAALCLAEAGRKVCVVEAGPTLGVEIADAWLNTLPECEASRRVLELCRQNGVLKNGRIDVLLATIAFDRVAEEAGIKCLVRVLPVRPLVSSDGRLDGVEVVGRSGRQALRAPLILDATEGRSFTLRAMGLEPLRPTVIERRAYLYGVEFPEPTEPSMVRYQGKRGIVFRAIPTVWPGESLLCVTMSTDDSQSGTELDSESYLGLVGLVAGLKSFDSRFFESTLVDIAPHYLGRYRDERSDWQAVEAAGLIPLPLADVLSREVEQSVQVAEKALQVSERAPLPLAGNSPEIVEVFTGHELEADPEWDFSSVCLPQGIVKVHPPCDVVVAGYGTAGALAALAARETGVRVTVVDPLGIPGGTGTAGRIHYYYYGLPGGLQDRLDQLVSERSAALGKAVHGYHPVAKADVLLRELRNKGVALFSGHTAFGVTMDGRQITGVLTASTDGYHLFPCKVAVDASGNADLAAAAGCGFELGRKGDGFAQPYSYTPTRVVEGVLGHHNFDAGWCDPCDTLDYSRAHFEGRRRIWRLGPYDEKRHYCTLAWMLGVREGRLVQGMAQATCDDFLRGVLPPDTICEGYAHYDNHSLDYALESTWARRHVVMFGMFGYLIYAKVPFGALIPADIKGLLVACRGFSVDHDGHMLLRMQRDIQKIGEICGVAAAQSVQSGILPHKLEVDHLRKQLQERGIRSVGTRDSILDLSGEELLQLLGGEKTGPAMWRLSQLPADQAPDWSVFFARETDPARRFYGAVAVALGPVPSDEARTELRRGVRQKDSAPSFEEGSVPRCVVAALALAEMGDDQATELIGELLLSDKFDPPTTLLLLKGLAVTRNPAGVGPIREFLEKNKQETFTMPLRGGRPVDSESLRFAVELLAVQVLLQLGNRDELARLTAYVDHEHLLIRKWARRIAREAGAE